ncbi:MAG: CPBP family intramembrane metalloprotease [Micromonosporaceae bacterium]|nr:CPBP family intramembrane metalloprotease [Micromonosporaceae bacterium]
MSAGTLAVGAAAVVHARPAGHDELPRPYRWPVAVLLHLAPGAAVMAGYLALLPLVRALQAPASLALTGAVALIGVPVQLGFLRHARRREQGNVVAYRRFLPTGRLAALAGSCLALAAGLYLWLEPLAGMLERDVLGWLPAAWFAVDDSGVPRTALAGALLLSLVVDGLVGPVVRELYFRGHLMPRLPVAAAPAGWLLAPLASAALYAVQHLWQPQLILLVFAVQAVLGVLVWRTRCLAVAVVVHAACNVLATGLTLLAVL